MQTIDFELRDEFIALDTLLKATGLVSSGGAAKVLVLEGRVQVDGQMESRRTCKIRAGQLVCVGATLVRVHAPTLYAPLD